MLLLPRKTNPDISKKKKTVKTDVLSMVVSISLSFLHICKVPTSRKMRKNWLGRCYLFIFKSWIFKRGKVLLVPLLLSSKKQQQQVQFFTFFFFSTLKPHIFIDDAHCSHDGASPCIGRCVITSSLYYEM